MKTKAIILLCALHALCTHTASFAGTHDIASLTSKFYAARQQPVYWYASTDKMRRIRAAIKQVAENGAMYGLDKKDYAALCAADTQPEDEKRDRIFTQTMLALCFDLYEGAHIEKYIRNDEVTNRYKSKGDSVVLSWLLSLDNAADPLTRLAQLEPQNPAYITLKTELKKQLDSGNYYKVRQLNTTINIYRWIWHCTAEKCIVVNIPAAQLAYYHSGQQELMMRVIVGKPSTRTPRFSSWCDKVILYPYWNVPRDIARKELLPQFKRSPARLGAMNMQLIGANGRIVDPYSLNWASYSAGYFPFTVRQCTGCDNSLGVIKFNLTDPFSVYLHDTNHKPAFMSDYRYLSHGCIRVSQPVELGNALLDNKLDKDFLAACLKHQEPMTMNLKTPVPVFVVYMTADVAEGAVKYYKDIYHLNR